MTIPITVTILTKNSQKHLHKVLDALHAFDEILVYDTGSTDNTMSIAKNYSNVTLHEGPFIGFGPVHNSASSLARHDWILSIDSDEVATPELVKELSALQLDKICVYSVWRQNYYNGRWIRWCGWYPDRQVKLYNRQQTHFSDAQVHESVIVNGFKVVQLNSPVQHYPYENTTDFLNKMQNYSTLYAKQAKGKRSSLTKAVTHGLFAFVKSYILKKGFLGGREGFIISVYNGNTAFYKYLKLIDVNAQDSDTPSP